MPRSRAEPCIAIVTWDVNIKQATMIRKSNDTYHYVTLNNPVDKTILVVSISSDLVGY